MTKIGEVTTDVPASHGDSVDVRMAEVRFVHRHTGPDCSVFEIHCDPESLQLSLRPKRGELRA